MSANEVLNLVFCTLDTVTVAISAADVRGLDVMTGDLPCRDLADVLGIPIDGPRRRLRVQGEPEFDVLVGGTITVREVPKADVLPLPALIRGLKAEGLVGLLPENNSFALIFDSRKLTPEGSDE